MSVESWQIVTGARACSCELYGKTLSKYACNLERQILDVMNNFSFSQSSLSKKQVVDEVLAP